MTKKQLDQRTATALYSTVDGAGLDRCRSKNHNAWATGAEPHIEGWEYPRLAQLRIAALPTRARSYRGKGGLNDTTLQCRKGCQRRETLVHISGSCWSTREQRLRGHNIIVNSLVSQAQQQRKQVIIEPHIMTAAGLRKPDLIVYDEKKAMVIDAAVPCETTTPSLSTSSKKKAEYYKDEIRRYVTTRLPGRDVSFHGFVVSAQGGFSDENAEVCRALRMSPRQQQLLVVRVMMGTWHLWRHFSADYL